MSPVEALKAGTIASAQSLGMAKDIGSIEVGKLADLVILSDDPSVDIANSDNIEQVMLGGRLYDAKTLNEVGTGDAKRHPYWWEANGGKGAGGSAEATAEGRGHADGDAG
jgi:adenine deaminase